MSTSSNPSAANSTDAATERLMEFAGKVMGDVGSAFATLLAFIGDQTGVFAALRDTGRCDSATLAKAAKVDARYLREWLCAMAASSYVTYHADDETFSLTPEQATVFAQEGHPACMQGLIQLAVAQMTTHDKAIEVFASGRGRPWGEHHGCCFCATDRFFRPGYAVNLVDVWLPALEGVVAKLERGARVADIGCGYGASTALMAKAFPRSTFYGFDFHAPSIAIAQAQAQKAGLANTIFETVGARDITQNNFDLICMFDALHDMGDPVGIARHLRTRLAPDGVFMLVEPLAGDSLTENLHVLGQLYYSASTLICTPASRAQEVGLALGAQAGQKRLTEVLNAAGFSRVRRAAQSDANMVLEARV